VNGAGTVRSVLGRAGLAPVDARALLGFVTGRDRAWLVAHADDALDAVQVDRFLALAARRREGEPVAYLTGRREFWGLDLEVSPAVLIPRPETETLVETALAALPAEGSPRVLDLGTGSGAIALAIARERPRARLLATDRSDAALEVARRNAARLGIANVEWRVADWYEGLAPGAYDAILANPPYVAAGDPHLDAGDLRFEPALALTPGADGLAALRIIVAGATNRLKPGGLLAVEHGHDQAEAVLTLFREAGLTGVAGQRDLAGVARVVAGRRP